MKWKVIVAMSRGWREWKWEIKVRKKRVFEDERRFKTSKCVTGFDFYRLQSV